MGDLPEATYAYDEALDALVVSVHGRRTAEQAKAHFRAVLARMDAEATSRVLLDLTDAEYDFDLDRSAEAFSNITAGAEGRQIALVLDVSQREKGLIAQTLATARWNLARLFHDVEAARRWLEETLD